MIPQTHGPWLHPCSLSVTVWQLWRLERSSLHCGPSMLLVSAVTSSIALFRETVAENALQQPGDLFSIAPQDLEDEWDFT